MSARSKTLFLLKYTRKYQALYRVDYIQHGPIQHIHLNRCISIHSSCQILSPSETGFIVSAHRLPNITLLTLIATLLLQGESPNYILK